jgi:hypothetical protein
MMPTIRHSFGARAREIAAGLFEGLYGFLVRLVFTGQSVDSFNYILDLYSELRAHWC